MAVMDRRETDRLLIAIAGAIVLHAGLYFGVPYLIELRAAQVRIYGPVTLHLEEAAPLEIVEVTPPATVVTPEPVTVEPEPAAVVQPLPAAPVAKTVVQPAPTPAPTPKAAPAAPAPRPVTAPSLKPRLTERAAAVAQSQATTKLAADPGAPIATRTSGTPAFRQAGEATGSSAGTVDASVVPGPEPTLPASVPSATPSDPSAGQQRSGEGVLVGGRTSASTPLDLGKLDKSLSSTGTAATGASGSSTTSRATGSTVGSATGSTTSASDITWETPGAGKARTLVSAPLPKVPAWVSEQGLTLTAKVAFTLNAEGLLTGVRIAQGSGYSDVDAAVVDAVRNWRFTAAPGAAPIRGTVPCTIRSR